VRSSGTEVARGGPLPVSPMSASPGGSRQKGTPTGGSGKETGGKIVGRKGAIPIATGENGGGVKEGGEGPWGGTAGRSGAGEIRSEERRSNATLPRMRKKEEMKPTASSGEARAPKKKTPPSAGRQQRMKDGEERTPILNAKKGLAEDCEKKRGDRLAGPAAPGEG